MARRWSVLTMMALMGVAPLARGVAPAEAQSSKTGQAAGMAPDT